MVCDYRGHISFAADRPRRKENRRRRRGSLPSSVKLSIIAARAMAPTSSRNFGEQDFVTSHKPWSLQLSNFGKKFKFLFGFRTLI